MLTHKPVLLPWTTLSDSEIVFYSVDVRKNGTTGAWQMAQ